MKTIQYISVWTDSTRIQEIKWIMYPMYYVTNFLNSGENVSRVFPPKSYKNLKSAIKYSMKYIRCS